jgi:amidophosphoribosyltransferase
VSMPWDDKPKEECGLFGILCSEQDVSQLTYFGLYAPSESRTGKRRYCSI